MNLHSSPFVKFLFPRNAFSLGYLLIQVPPAVEPAASISSLSTVTPSSSLIYRILRKRLGAARFGFLCFLSGFGHIISLLCKYVYRQSIVNSDCVRVIKKTGNGILTVWLLAGRHKGGYLACLNNSSEGENGPVRETLTRFRPCFIKVLQYPCKSRTYSKKILITSNFNMLYPYLQASTALVWKKMAKV